jgi:hypothetical protein
MRTKVGGQPKKKLAKSPISIKAEKRRVTEACGLSYKIVV